jgi:hypothetical protein
MIPSKLNKMTWVRKGGFVIVEESDDANIDTKVTGTLIQVPAWDQRSMSYVGQMDVA